MGMELQTQFLMLCILLLSSDGEVSFGSDGGAPITTVLILVNDIAWTVGYRSHRYFVGRDSVADSASATGYFGIETIIATGGDDQLMVVEATT